MGVPLPTNETFDGKSLASVVVPSVKPVSDESTLRQWALSQFMRCPPDNASEKDFWEGGTCLFVDRAQMQVQYFASTLANNFNVVTVVLDWNVCGIVYGLLPASPGMALHGMASVEWIGVIC